MPDLMKKDDCEKIHTKLDKDVERAIEVATASVEARIKIWILMAVIPILATLIYFFVDIGSYRERVDNSSRRIDRLEQEIRSHQRNERRVP